MEKNIRVLVVDDERRFAENTAKLLGRRGFEVKTAFDGFQALEAVRTSAAFDIVILDVKMPGMDGVETLKAIKRLTPAVEVIMLTGHATVDSGTRAMRSGAFDYLLKPCDIENLVAKINEAYQVERIKQRPVLWPRNKIEDITRQAFIHLSHQDSLARALDIFNRYPRQAIVEKVFVQDAGGRLCGSVTRRDLINQAEIAHPGNSLSWSDLVRRPGLLPEKPLEQVMHAELPPTSFPQASLTDSAHRMITHNVRYMPVVDKNRVIGIVRLQDILRHIEHETE